MATTWIKPIRFASVAKSIEYVANIVKTNNGQYVTTYECSQASAADEFALYKRMYEENTNRPHKVLAYHMRQAFKPGEITPEQANKIGYEIAKRFTKGKHQFIVCTHVDRRHIHNHIIFNAVNLECDRKFRNFAFSSFALRRLSDHVCVENNLSVIEKPKLSKGKNADSHEYVVTWKDKLRLVIDDALSRNPSSFEELLSIVAANGYEVKKGKHIAFRHKEQQRFTRLRSLGNGYSEQDLQERISVAKTRESTPQSQTTSNSEVNLLIDIQAKLKAGKGAGYEKWAKLFNLKQAARTLVYLEESNVTSYAELERRASEASDTYKSNMDEIRRIDGRLQDISALQRQIASYGKTRDVFERYKRSGYSKKFYAEHKEAIDTHRQTKQYFSSLDLPKLPNIKSLRTEYATLREEKNRLYKQYYDARSEMKKLQIAKANVDVLYGKTNRAAAFGREEI